MMFFIEKYKNCLEDDNIDIDDHFDIDDTHYLPIHVLCEMYSNERTSTNAKKREILEKLNLIRKDFGLSSLQLAIEKDLFSWEDGMKLLFESNPNDLEMIDPKTKLYPFMLSGVTCGSLDMTYMLLCSNPTLLKPTTKKRTLNIIQ